MRCPRRGAGNLPTPVLTPYAFPLIASGDQYEGDWKDDRRHGKGTVTYAAVEGGAAEKYEGDWSDGKMHG